MFDGERLNRRTVLKSIGGAAGTALVGGAGLAALSGGAAAQAGIDMTIDDASVSNDRGEVDYVGVDMSKDIKWDGFDVPVKYIGFKHEIATDANKKGWHTLYGEKVSDPLPDWENYGDDEKVVSYTTDESEKPDGTKGHAQAGIVWEIITDGTAHDYGYEGSHGPQTPAEWAGDLTVTEDGATQTHQVRFRTTLYFYEGKNNDDEYVPVSESDGIPKITGTAAFNVTVSNETAETTNTESTGYSKAE